jgi:uncharacterized membrane protein
MMNDWMTWLMILCALCRYDSRRVAVVAGSHWNARNHPIWGICEANIKKNWSTLLTRRSSLKRVAAHIQVPESAKNTTTVDLLRDSSSSIRNDTMQEQNCRAKIELSPHGSSVGSNNGSAIKASAVIELPFPKRVAYDAFADLSRQTEFSPWLKSVEFLEGDGTDAGVGSITRWILSYLGVRLTWNAISTLQDPRNGILEWESISGLRNNGRVTFQEISEDRTHMNLTMSIAVPKVVAFNFRPKNLASMLERHILDSTLRNFRQNVMENEWKNCRPQNETIATPSSSSSSTPIRM